jgi:tRNA nucleotidyltransferase (CCA-adding enzyme)
VRVIDGDWPVPPTAVRDIAQQLERDGHEVWCVGGAVRDALLGQPHLDWDLATSATPDRVRRLFRRTVPLGIEFGTVGVLDSSGGMHEVTTFRKDVSTDGRHAVVQFGVSLEDDLARRDFTINAIAVSPDGRRLADPFNGRGDLERRVVRAVGEPRARLAEDRLRALRAIRFAARLDFTIDDPTFIAIRESAPFMARLSAERVKQEIEKTMEQVRRPSAAFREWRDAGLFAAVAPRFAAATDAGLSAIDAVPMALAGAAPARRALRRLQRLATLCASIDATSALAQLRALRFSNADQAWVGRVIRGAAAHGASLERAAQGALSASQLERLGRQVAHDVGRLDAADVVRVSATGWSSATSRAGARATYRVVRRSAERAAVSVADLAVDGEDLASRGVPPGPMLGATLRALLEAVLDEPALNTREQLLMQVDAILSGGTAHASS